MSAALGVTCIPYGSDWIRLSSMAFTDGLLVGLSGLLVRPFAEAEELPANCHSEELPAAEESQISVEVERQLGWAAVADATATFTILKAASKSL